MFIYKMNFSNDKESLKKNVLDRVLYPDQLQKQIPLNSG